MTARRERRAPTQAEAEAWREGYEAARKQAEVEARNRMLLDGGTQRKLGYTLACNRIADAIARMEPEGKG
jgi:hypothetical protein